MSNAYRVGDIVNGHMLTSTETGFQLVPVAVPAPPAVPWWKRDLFGKEITASSLPLRIVSSVLFFFILVPIIGALVRMV